MRIGQNPAKSIDYVPQPARVTVALITYIPFLSGYYAQSLEVLKLCLQSLAQDASVPFDLMVFDNASCLEVRNYLLDCQTNGQIQYLVLSDKNVGKGGGWNFIFQAAPGETVAYADSDILFRPGWLSESLAILEAFPQAGMVTARPMRSPEAYYTTTLEWAQQYGGAKGGVELEQGNFIPWEVYLEHVTSLGTSEEQARQWYESRSDWRVKSLGVSAIIGAAHFQFTVRKAAIRPFLPFHMDRPMGQVRTLDEQMNQAGLLRLSTCQPLVKHLGNTLPFVAGGAANGTGLNPSLAAQSPVRGPRRGGAIALQRFYDLPWVKKILLRLYDRIFRLYH